MRSISSDWSAPQCTELSSERSGSASREQPNHLLDGARRLDGLWSTSGRHGSLWDRSVVWVCPWTMVVCRRQSMWNQTRTSKADYACQTFHEQLGLYLLANVNVRYMSSSVRLSVCRLSVTFVHPTQAIEIFGNISMPCGTLAICWHPGKILRRSSQGNPSVVGVKHERGSRI